MIAEPQIAREGDNLCLTYRRLQFPASDVVYLVEQSPDLVVWMPATVSEQILSTEGVSEMVKASVDVTGLPQLFLRLRIYRP